MSVDIVGGDLRALGERIDNLEMRIAYQDDVIEQLNAVIVSQWAKFDQMKAMIERLDGRLREGLDTAAGADTFNNQPPPHY